MNFVNILPCLAFILNIWLINRGSGFTVPREMLFRNYADVKMPIIAFPFILAALWLAAKYLWPKLQKLPIRTKTVLIFLFCLLSAFSLFFTVQTNPDYGGYQAEAKYLVAHGPIAFLKDWGSFNCPFNMPTISFIRGLAYLLLGEEELAVLLVNFLITLGILTFTYLSAKKLFNQKTAWLSIILLASSPFFISQTPLFLVDLGLTFLLVFSFYLLLKLREEPKIWLAVFIGIILFLTSIAKVFGLIYLAAIFAIYLIYVLRKTKSKKFWSILFLPWLIMGLLDLGYFFWKIESFAIILSHFTSIKKISCSLLPVPLFGIICAALLVKKDYLLKYAKKYYHLLPWFIYLILGYLFFFGQRSLFYLRTTIIGFSLPAAIFFFASIYFAFKKRSWPAILLLIWFASVFFVPNTMFKYQFPTYPAVVMLIAFGLTSVFKQTQKQISALIVVLAFSFSITYFFFLPMINTHVKNNFRQAASYANKINPEKIVLLFAPLGDYGQMLQESLDKVEACPHPPSLVDIMDYYTKSEIVYLNNNSFVKATESGQAPEMVFLALHLDVPTKLDPRLQEALISNYQQGQLFDQAKGSGIWRVKIQIFSRKNQKQDRVLPPDKE